MLGNSLPSVSVCIPTYNGFNWLKKSKDTFLSQSYPGNLEFVFLDSGSNDSTVPFISTWKNATILKVEKHKFNHGLSRNTLAKQATGFYIIFTVQDAEPKDKHWVSDLVQTMIEHELDALCSGQAIPPVSTNNPIQWQTAPPTKSVQILHEGAGDSPYKHLGWDNVNSIYKASALSKIPFRNVPFAEDLFWCKDAIIAGLRIANTDITKVWHYHQLTNPYLKNRYTTEVFWKYKALGCIPPKRRHPLVSVISDLRTLLRITPSLSLKTIIIWLRHNYSINTTVLKIDKQFCSALKSPGGIETFSNGDKQEIPIAQSLDNS